MTINSDSLKGDLAIELDADSISAGDFYIALEAFLTLLREITRGVNNKMPRDAWLLRVQEGSQVIAIHADSSRLSPEVASNVYSAMFDGLDSLESEATIPMYYTESALESARTLSRIAQGKKDRHVPIRILSRKRSHVVTRNMFNNVSEILDWKYEDLGTVEGTLEVVSAHNGYEFRIYEPVWQRVIRCNFDEELLKEALGCFKKRVEVQGLVRYTKDGFPVSIKVLKIAEFPDSSDLPSFREMRGILGPSQ